MAQKNIPLSKEKYETLDTLKDKDETFNEVIERLNKDRMAFMKALGKEQVKYIETEWKNLEKKLKIQKRQIELLEPYLDQHTKNEIQEALEEYKKIKKGEKSPKELKKKYIKNDLTFLSKEKERKKETALSKIHHSLQEKIVFTLGKNSLRINKHKFTYPKAPKDLAEALLTHIKDILTNTKVQERLEAPTNKVIGAEIKKTKEVSGRRWKYMKRNLKKVPEELDEKIEEKTGKTIKKYIEEVEENPERYTDEHRVISKKFIETRMNS